MNSTLMNIMVFFITTKQVEYIMTTNDLDFITIEPTTPATHTIIILHGLGADGGDFTSIVPELKLPANLAVRFIFPHAPQRPITINNGYHMRGWYDITSLTAEGRDDHAGIQTSLTQIEQIMAQQEASGIESNKIILMGFSQGAAMALTTGLRHTKPLAGIIALSGYLPVAKDTLAIASPANKNIPIFIGHGTADAVVMYQWGQKTSQTLQQAGYNVDWHSYPMQHTVCLEEINDISQWIQKRFGK
ncbi:MAG: alpha/beta hydrolase [Gammaproteobacteria bacterium]